jgi:rhodanese-related sulfurtransferase
MKTISTTQLKNLLDQGKQLCLVDVRTPAEYAAAHVEGAKNIPLGSINTTPLEGMPSPVYLLCKSGTRAKQAQQMLTTRGVQEAYCVEGGTAAATTAGVPISYGANQVISIERQVRIIAGALVVLGVVLGVTISPYLLGISAFVGAGLVFAGVTDWCGMAIILEKLPWNNGTSSCTAKLASSGQSSTDSCSL